MSVFLDRDTAVFMLIFTGMMSLEFSNEHPQHCHGKKKVQVGNNQEKDFSINTFECDCVFFLQCTCKND